MPELAIELIGQNPGTLQSIKYTSVADNETIAQLRASLSIAPWSFLVDGDGSIVSSSSPVNEVRGSKLVEYQRLGFDLVNPHSSDVALRSSVGADIFCHEHPGPPNWAIGPVLIADPGNNDGHPNATVFGDAAICGASRCGWEVEVLSDGCFAVGAAPVEGTDRAQPESWLFSLNCKGGGCPRPTLLPGPQTLTPEAAARWEECESPAKKIAVLVDLSTSPQRVMFTLEGRTLGAVDVHCPSQRPPAYPALQVNWDDLCCLHIVPYESYGSLSKDELSTVKMYLQGIGAQYPTTRGTLARLAAEQLSEETLTYAVWPSPARGDGEDLEAYALKVIDCILREAAKDAST